MRSALDALPAHYLGAPNVMAVEATATAWTAGDAWLESVREVLDENRHALSDLLAAHLPGVRYTPPDATYLAWLDCRDARPRRRPRRRRSASAASSSAPARSSASRATGFVRLNFATSPAILAETVAAMAGNH